LCQVQVVLWLPLRMISLPRFDLCPILRFFLSWIGRVAVTVAVTRRNEALIDDIVALSLSSSTGIGGAPLFSGTMTCWRLLRPPTTFLLPGTCCFFAYKRTCGTGILLWFSPQYDRSNFPFGLHCLYITFLQVSPYIHIATSPATCKHWLLCTNHNRPSRLSGFPSS
jgi:hypothetical protein